jgi:regulator of protease activity HflC (stomatin/prohibitin superfamily)
MVYCSQTGNNFRKHPIRWLLGIGAVTIILIIIASVIATSFVYIEPGQYALLEGTHGGNSGIIQTPYRNGRQRPGWGFKKHVFPAPMQTIVYKSGSPHGIVLAFADNGLEFEVECSFDFWIVFENLYVMYDKYRMNYMIQISSVGLRALKNVAPRFSLTEYIQNRTLIHREMYTYLKRDVESICGNVTCVTIPNSAHFQLRRVHVPSAIHETWSTTSIQSQINARQEYERQTILVEKETERLQAEIIANKSRIEIGTQNQVTVIRANADAYSIAKREEAAGVGIASVVNKLNLTSTEGQEFYRLWSIRGSNDPELTRMLRAKFVLDDTNTKVVYGSAQSFITV